YFAAMHMAAEFSTGSLLFQYIDKKTRFSMLLVETEAQFHKKAVGKIKFSCTKGPEVDSFVQEVQETTEGATITLPVEVTNENGDLVATFKYNWSCRSK
ncbi:thioesterase, partial [Bacteroidia bacterium]|nr:thioesterase [Bacteroidia bacterium]